MLLFPGYRLLNTDFPAHRTQLTAHNLLDQEYRMLCIREYHSLREWDYRSFAPGISRSAREKNFSFFKPWLPFAPRTILLSPATEYRQPLFSREAILPGARERYSSPRLQTSRPPHTANGPQSSLIDVENGKESLLRYLDPADLLHALLALLLLFQEFSFTADISTVTFGKNVLAHG